MRRFLIDTQAFIWLINDDKRLGHNTKLLLKSPLNEINLSYFSLFEMQVKAAIGKFKFDSNVIEAMKSEGINLLLPNESTLLNYKIYNKNNRDPFDNALISVSLQNKLEIVTSNKKILNSNLKDLTYIDARK